MKGEENTLELIIQERENRNMNASSVLSRVDYTKSWLDRILLRFIGVRSTHKDTMTRRAVTSFATDARTATAGFMASQVKES